LVLATFALVTLHCRPETPIYVIEPADRGLLVPGAYVVVNATQLPTGPIWSGM
jgi:hypothetical protein